MSATVNVILYKSKRLKNGEHPLMLRVTKDRKRKYKSLGISCKPEMWDEKNGVPKKKHPNADMIQVIINKKKAAYLSKIIEMKMDEREITSTSLVSKIEKPYNTITIFDYTQELIDRFKTAGKIGNSHVYKEMLSSFKKFRNNEDLPFSDLEVRTLNKYETFLRSKGNAETTMALRIRTLRTVFNKAIDEGITKRAYYPFNTYKLSKFNLQTKKRALNEAEIRKIESANLEENTEAYLARDLFMFSFYGQGINFVDMSNLRWKDIQDDRVFYQRIKTGKHINFALLPPALRVLDYWKPLTHHSDDDYVFPILNREVHISPTQIDNRCHKMLTKINRALKEIGTEIGLGIPLTTYVARHSFATMLKNKGISTAIISEAMGHKSESVTVTYLKSFENHIIDDAMKQLL